MKAASKRNLEKVLTGDGCDELFGGYTYLFGMS
jgi:asparagine synthetase B (glutamine-hydrolysing)